MRPTSRNGSVDKVDVDLDAITSGSGAHHGADALRRTTTAADDPAEIAGPNLHLELQAVPAFDSVDVHGIRIVHDRTNDMGENGGRCGSRSLNTGLVAAGLIVDRLDSVDSVDFVVWPIGDRLVGHLAARAALNSAIAPDTSKSFLTRSVG